MNTVRSVLIGLCGIAAAGTVGSLYFSLFVGLPPCDLCWYQRILLYPLVVVFGVAAYENRAAAWLTALPFAVLGIPVAAYHSYLQVAAGAQCTLGGPCGAILFSALGGLVTLPRLSLLSFLAITVGTVYLARETAVGRTAAA